MGSGKDACLVTSSHYWALFSERWRSIATPTTQQDATRRSVGAEYLVCGLWLEEPGKRLPTKAVGSLKPPARQKGRNYAADRAEDLQNPARGVDSVAIQVRTMLAVRTQKQWEVGSIDVRAAFLQAPPSLTKHHLREPWRSWNLEHALYGLVESPGD